MKIQFSFRNVKISERQSCIFKATREKEVLVSTVQCIKAEVIQWVAVEN